MVKVYLVNECFDVPREGTFTQLANAFSSKVKATNYVRKLENLGTNSDGHYYVIEEVEVH